jgi:hypothetical protein
MVLLAACFTLVPRKSTDLPWGVCRLHLQCQRISQALLATCFTLVSYLSCSSTLKMVTTCSSEISVHFQRTTRRYIPEDITQWSPLREPQIHTGLLIHNCHCNQHSITLASLHRQGHTLQCTESPLTLYIYIYQSASMGTQSTRKL